MERFFFDHNTLQYQKVELSGKQKLTRFLYFMIPSVIVAAGIMLYADSNFESSKLTRLLATQQDLTYEIGLVEQDVRQYDKMLEDIRYNDDQIYRVYFEVDPLPATVRDAGSGGNVRYTDLQNSKFSGLLIPTFRDIDALSRKLVVQMKSFEDVVEMAKSKEARLAARPAIQPISTKDLTRFGSAFGMRLHPILKVYRMHEGIDLTCPRGTNIYASADGTVIEAEFTNGGYGKKIVIDHGYGYTTLYGHCSKILVEKGQKVKRGEVIGLVGNTGLSTCPHLHYEVRINNRPVNPIYYYANDLSAGEYEKMIDMLSNADPNFDIN
ncbi:MAG: M23 family metallopeptidase [Bacteroidota bacterium]